MTCLETPRFPDMLALGLTVGPSFNTRIVSLANGKEQRNQRWSQVRWFADAASAVRTMTDFQTLEDFFYAVGGRTHSFRVKDYADYLVTTANGHLQPLLNGQPTGTTGYGAGLATYQLIRRYTVGAFSHDRRIVKPVSGQVALFRGGNPVTIGAGVGQAAINYTTGVITFTGDQGRSIVSHTVGATHKFTFNSAFSPNFTNGQKIWVFGVTGTAATLLNSMPLTITAVSGADITVSVNTTGKTASNGSGEYFPQASETLTWSGQFDVHVRFDVDRLDRNMIVPLTTGIMAVQATSIPLIEDRGV
jgi:uncharacterized protein (TIGR02217 family)